MMLTPCCHQPFVAVDSSNLDACPKCGKWYLIKDDGTVSEVV